jgi:Fe-S-cluster containining protein
MADGPLLQTRPLEPDEKFRFRCGPELSCFTDCCSQIDLALSPYDVLRLRRGLGLDAAEFLDRYAVVEKEEGAAFPQVYLALVDDERYSCPFVTPRGCAVYHDRPGACRTYPLGRGARRRQDGTVDDFYVVISETHCRGFDETQEQTSAAWLADQELHPYNEFNDLTLQLLQHPRIREGFRPDLGLQERFLQLLYDPDSLRRERPDAHPDQERLLRLAHELLYDELSRA